jgi:formate hydrogenlyase subunit 3/multisubunit Na+/H+ antiporter MnhD subunit
MVEYFIVVGVLVALFFLGERAKAWWEREEKEETDEAGNSKLKMALAVGAFILIALGWLAAQFAPMIAQNPPVPKP